MIIQKSRGEGVIDYNDKFNREFVAWINSINSGFQNMIEYPPFEDYKAQSDEWMKDATSIDDFVYRQDKIEWVKKEFNRFRENTVYFINKVGSYKDADRSDDAIKMKATKAQEVLLFLADNRYNIIAGKGRQVAFTTAMGMYAIKKISYVTDYFCKFITHTGDKGEEILRDKFKYPFTNLPDWARVSAETSYSTTAISTGARGKTKAERKGTGATVEVCSPTDDAINGGSPQLVLIDEIGFIKNITTIIREGKPTMFSKDNRTGKLEMKRQLIAWGTASLKGTTISYFKEAFQNCKAKWDDGDYSYGIIPLFFNCYARDGFTKENYINFKRQAEETVGVEREEEIMTFHQHYPLSIEDMFVSGSKTIIPFNTINNKISEIRVAEAHTETQYPQYGYFDTANGPIEDFISGKIRDVPQPIWNRTSGLVDIRTTCVIYSPPEPGWLWRYYKGTDPINSKTGHSKFASVIWDEEKKASASVVNYRRRNYKECYLQGILQTLHYSNPQHSVRELCENNIGDAYLDMLENFGMKTRYVIQNSLLPPGLQGGDNDFGIKKHSGNAPRIMNNIVDMLLNHMDTINDEQLYLQLKTFVEKEKRDTGWVSYAPESRYDFDDVIDATVYGFIASKCFRYEPRKNESQKNKVVTKYIQNASTGWQVRRARVIDGKTELL